LSPRTAAMLRRLCGEVVAEGDEEKGQGGDCGQHAGQQPAVVQPGALVLRLRVEGGLHQSELCSGQGRGEVRRGREAVTVRTGEGEGAWWDLGRCTPSKRARARGASWGSAPCGSATRCSC